MALDMALFIHDKMKLSTFSILFAGRKSNSTLSVHWNSPTYQNVPSFRNVQRGYDTNSVF